LVHSGLHGFKSTSAGAAVLCLNIKNSYVQSQDKERNLAGRKLLQYVIYQTLFIKNSYNAPKQILNQR